MKIALAQINPIVGDLAGNRDRVIESASRAAKLGADLVLLPEMVITGYPPRDLLDYPPFIQGNLMILKELAERLPVACLVGHVDRNPIPTGNGLLNAASLLADGKIQATYHKMLLPSYDVFDEARYFEPGAGIAPVPFRGHSLGLTICEDIWNEAEFLSRPYSACPVELVARAGADVILNISASPWRAGKLAVRHALCSRQAADAGIPLLYCNQAGGNDELIFDGASMVFDGEGNLRHQSASFAEDMTLIDLDDLPPVRELSMQDRPAEMLDGLTLGLSDYARKTGFTRFLIGLSGGIDSAVTAALAVRSFSPDQVTGVTMPSQFSSTGSVDDSHELARQLGIRLIELPINGIYDAFIDVLSEEFAGLPFNVAEENIQARTRGNLLMALSNKLGHLVLTTGNKSELAVGYCTLYGDMCGGLAVISDVPKTMVYELAQEINRQAERDVIPRSTIVKPPSAELRPDQKDQDSLPPYDVLDGILACYLEELFSLEQIVAQGYDRETVTWILAQVTRNEYKRWQAAPGLRATSKAFGVGRRMPIAQRYKLQ